MRLTGIHRRLALLTLRSARSEANASTHEKRMKLFGFFILRALRVQNIDNQASAFMLGSTLWMGQQFYGPAHTPLMDSDVLGIGGSDSRLQASDKAVRRFGDLVLKR
jgi:hypothetical protein